jgi:hypothetical protein
MNINFFRETRAFSSCPRGTGKYSDALNDIWSFCVGFVVDKVARGEVFPLVLRFFPLSVSFQYCSVQTLCCTLLDVDSVVTYQLK